MNVSKSIYILVAGAVMAIPASGRDTRNELVHITTTEQAPFQAGETVVINHSFGELWVEGWDEPNVEITVTKSPDELYGRQDRAAADRLAGRVKVTTDRTGGQLVINTAVGHFSRWRHPFSGRGDVMMEYRIRVPRNAKLVIHHEDGEVMVTNMSSDIEATGHTGDIVVMVPEGQKYSVDAKSRLGTMFSDFEGDFRHVLWSNDFATNADAPAHRLYLRMGIGGIAIKGAAAEKGPGK